MKRAVAAFASLLILVAVDARAQIGRVAGTVIDDAGRPVKGATITAENREQSPSVFTSSTDAKGRFSVLGMRRGSWIVTIQAPGYETTAARVDVVTTRPNPPLDVKLVKGSAPAAPGPLVGIDSKEIQRRIDLAESFDKADDHVAALRTYRELLSRVPALTSIYLRLGAIHERSKDIPAAIAAYRRLVELEPDNLLASAAIQRLSGR